MMSLNDRGDGNTSTKMDDDSVKKEVSVGFSEEIDLFAYYEEAAGRLVVDPECVS